MRHILATLANDEQGNDLIEYALLAASVGAAGVLALQAFPGIMNAVYQSWDVGTQNLWVTPEP